VHGPDEIARRLPVWHALSELFLDTQLQPEDYARIATSLKASGLPTDQIRDILEREVALAFSYNLLSVAGEWVPWSEDEVEEIIGKAMRAPNVLGWLRALRFRKYVAQEWQKLRSLLDA
jgi:hypothetical protein